MVDFNNIQVLRPLRLSDSEGIEACPEDDILCDSAGNSGGKPVFGKS